MRCLTPLAAGAVALGVSLASGCGYEEPVGYATVTSVPANIGTYPNVVYEGHPTYYYGNRWWYRGGDGRWLYYRNEPAALYRRRTYVVRPGY